MTKRNHRLPLLIGLAMTLLAALTFSLSGSETASAQPAGKARVRPANAVPAGVLTGDASQDPAFDAIPGDIRNRGDLTVMSLNMPTVCLDDGWCFHENDDPRPALTAVAEMMVANRVDVAGLQELTVGTDKFGELDTVQFLADELARLGQPMHHWFEGRHGFGGGTWGVAMFSRFPAQSYEAVDMGSPPQSPWSWTPLQVLKVRVNGHEVTIANTHLRVGDSHANIDVSCWQVMNGLLPYMTTKLDESTIMMGDFNTAPNHNCMDDIEQHWVDACELDGDASCAYTVDPVVHHGSINEGVTTYDVIVDYIFHRFADNPGAEMLNAWVKSDLNADMVIADHLPVFARYELGPRCGPRQPVAPTRTCIKQASNLSMGG